MSKADVSISAVSPMFRIVAVMVLFLSVTACGLQVLVALSTLDHPDPNTTVSAPGLFVSPLLTLIAGVGLSALLEGVARLVGAQQPLEQEDTAPLVNAMMAVAELQSSLPTLIGQALQESAPQTPAEVEISHVGPLDPGIEQHLARMVALMEEMKEVSLLDDSQRKIRRQQASQKRKTTRLEEAAQLIHAGNWEQADALLHLLESLHPGDADVLAVRNQLDDARILHQADGWDQIKPQVDALLAGAKFVDALELMRPFLERFPTHTDCRQLNEFVQQEQQAYLERTSNELYEQLKTFVEDRQWRKSLDCIQRFLDSYPEHARAGKIRQQVRVVQKNAEIEERQEQEERIRELINFKRYGDAADLSQELLERFPDSPQSAYLAGLLPKLRERATAEGTEIPS